MPPLSKTLVEEGAAIIAFKLVSQGVFQESGIAELLTAPGLLPNNYGTRNLSDNIRYVCLSVCVHAHAYHTYTLQYTWMSIYCSDLRAQVAANTRGASLMHELVLEYGLDVVQAYMLHIQNCAEESVREMLRVFSMKEGSEVCAEDFLDDGTPIRLKIAIDSVEGSAVFDFEGTGYVKRYFVYYF